MARSPRLSLAVLASIVLFAGCAGDGIAGLTHTGSPDSTTPKGVDPSPSSVARIVNVLAGARLWVDPLSNAQRTIDGWRATRPTDAAQLEKIARQPHVRWIGDWTSRVQQEVDAATTTITAAGSVPVFVAYNIPQRDCGGLSGGNKTTGDAYRSWITAFANGIGGRRAAVILEPDALAAMDCLSASDQQLRVDLLAYAVETFHAKGSTAVYLDAGNPAWQTPATMSARLARAGIALAQGFTLNVSNFVGTADNLTYGAQLSALVGGKHYIVDTSRNGLGAAPDHAWCNPAGRALGERPTTDTGRPLVDAYLWIKAPGESDGACNGSPSAGAWMPEYALGLAQRASY